MADITASVPSTFHFTSIPRPTPPASNWNLTQGGQYKPPYWEGSNNSGVGWHVRPSGLEPFSTHSFIVPYAIPFFLWTAVVVGGLYGIYVNKEKKAVRIRDWVSGKVEARN